MCAAAIADAGRLIGEAWEKDEYNSPESKDQRG
jgi:hypothetical protein